MATKHKIYQRSLQKAPLRQCEIISNLVEVRLASINPYSQQKPHIDIRVHPFAIVVSQDCDLEQDFRSRSPSGDLIVSDDKKLPSILFCEMITIDDLTRRSGINSKEWKLVMQNKNERYQFLEKIPAQCDALKTDITEMAIDFKRYFTIPSDQVYSQISRVGFHKHIGISEENPRMNKAHRRCIMFSPYLEQVSIRFCNFQSRIALPFDHQSEP